MGPTACPSPTSRETARSQSRLAQLGGGGHGAAISRALPAATDWRSTAITSAKSSSSASPGARPHQRREDRHDRLVPLLSHAQLLHAQECRASAETPVRRQPKLCKASAEGVLSPINRIRTEKMEPTSGFEPETFALPRRRSTT